MVRGPVSAGRREAWISGLVVGVVCGLVALVIPALGLLVAIVFAHLASVFRGGPAAAGGFGVGFGSCWLALLIRGIAVCQDFDSLPGSGCTFPDVAPWLVVGGGLAAVGAALTIAAIARSRRSARAIPT